MHHFKHGLTLSENTSESISDINFLLQYLSLMSHSLSHPLPYHIQIPITPSVSPTPLSPTSTPTPLPSPSPFSPSFSPIPSATSTRKFLIDYTLPLGFSCESLLHISYLQDPSCPDTALISIPSTSDPSASHDPSTPIHIIITTR